MVKLRRLILYDHHASLLCIVEQPVVVCAQIRTHCVRANTRYYHVVFLEISTGEILLAKEVYGHAQVLEGLGHVIPTPLDISHRKVCSYL